ncbi:MAG: sigma-54-dependent Fis family transcriptional regulator [Planctomycetes bacterium]|nr:sigma-54-dependent Fis family transcriptional regulator [Planctomycetota bacterium]
MSRRRSPQRRVLVVSPQARTPELLGALLAHEGYSIVAARDAADGLRVLANERPMAVVLDLMLPGGPEAREGLGLVRRLGSLEPDCPVVVLAPAADADEGRMAVALGAWEVLTSEAVADRLARVLQRAIAYRRMAEENRELRNRMRRVRELRLVGSGSWAETARDAVEELAGRDTAILVMGERGTGREHIARMIHARSRRAACPFVRRGAKAGGLRRAEGGTVYMDDVAELALPLQEELIEALARTEVRSGAGGSSERPDVRLIAATSHDLGGEVGAGRFREALYRRLQDTSLQVPPLRERREDIPALVAHFIRRMARDGGTGQHRVGEVAMGVLCAYDWPGNVDELEHALQRSVADKARGAEVGLSDLPVEVVREVRLKALRDRRDATARSAIPQPPEPLALVSHGGLPRGFDVKEFLEGWERSFLGAALLQAERNKREAARLVGLEEKTFLHKVNKKYRL